METTKLIAEIRKVVANLITRKDHGDTLTPMSIKSLDLVQIGTPNNKWKVTTNEGETFEIVRNGEENKDYIETLLAFVPYREGLQMVTLE